MANIASLQMAFLATFMCGIDGEYTNNKLSIIPASACRETSKDSLFHPLS